MKSNEILSILFFNPKYLRRHKLDWHKICNIYKEKHKQTHLLIKIELCLKLSKTNNMQHLSLKWHNSKQRNGSCKKLWNILSQKFKSYNVYQIYKWLKYHTDCQSTYVRKAAKKSYLKGLKVNLKKWILVSLMTKDLRIAIFFSNFFSCILNLALEFLKVFYFHFYHTYY